MLLRTLRKVKAMPPPMIISLTWSSMLLISWILSFTLALKGTKRERKRDRDRERERKRDRDRDRDRERESVGKNKKKIVLSRFVLHMATAPP